MKIKIEQLNIRNIKDNEVTSGKIFRPRKIVDKNGNLLFHPDGIFSKRIFGQYGHCDCVEEPKKKPGICPKCNVRVLSSKETPDYFISLDNIDVPKPFIDYSKYKKIKDKLAKLFNYEAYIYDGKLYDFDVLNLPEDVHKHQSKFLFGKDAILSLGVDEDWYKKQITNKIFIPHPTFRPIITLNDGKHYLGSLNEALLVILKKKAVFKKYYANMSKDKIKHLIISKEITESVKKVYEEVFLMLTKKKKSIIADEVKAQNITGAIRGVVTNNFSLDEDTIILGKYFVKTLYPELMLKHCSKQFVGIKRDGSNEQIWEPDLDKLDIKSLNAELLEKSYKVLVNRQPTIGEKSIVAMIPQFSEHDEEKYVLQVNPMIMDGLAGDFDGDALLCIALYTIEANKEAEKLLPSKNYIGSANNRVRNGLPEDLVYVMQKTYEDNVTDSINEMHDLIYGGNA